MHHPCESTGSDRTNANKDTIQKRDLVNKTKAERVVDLNAKRISVVPVGNTHGGKDHECIRK
jgi:hypothetical protein